MDKRDIDVNKILNNIGGWSLQVGYTNNHLCDEFPKKFKEFADKYVKYENLFELSQGHLAVNKSIALANELKKIKELDKTLDKNLLPYIDLLIEEGEFHEEMINGNDIDGYFYQGDFWFFPGGIINLINLYGLRGADNFSLRGKQLLDYLQNITSKYDTWRDLKIIPKFTDEELLSSGFNKLRVYEKWSKYVKKNEDIKYNLIKIDFEDAENKMNLKEYEGKYILYYIYSKYTPSDIVQTKVKEKAKEFVSKENLKDLEIIFLPSQYEGFAKKRKLFNDENGKYSFTGEEIHITFD